MMGASSTVLDTFKTNSSWWTIVVPLPGEKYLLQVPVRKKCLISVCLSAYTILIQVSCRVPVKTY